MKRRMLAVLITIMFIVSFTPTAVAEDTVGYTITSPASAVAMGDEFDVKISLSNYASLATGIQGIQIDISNIDPNVLEVVSHSALVSDTGAASNKTSYSSTQKYIRYVYLNMSGVMDKTVTDLMTVRLKINSTLTGNGSITLPVKLKIGTKTETQTDSITLEDSIIIQYRESSPTEIISVDVTWGSMEFAYDDGTWDTVSHRWINSGWNPINDNSNAIKVKNNGSSDVKVLLSYSSSTGHDCISGAFSDADGTILSEAIVLKSETEQTYYLNLNGTTEERWTDSYVKIGTSTLTLTE